MSAPEGYGLVGSEAGWLPSLNAPSSAIKQADPDHEVIRLVTTLESELGMLAGMVSALYDRLGAVTREPGPDTPEGIGPVEPTIYTQLGHRLRALLGGLVQERSRLGDLHERIML